ncbi:BTB/POZ and MATH domain-containing protein 4 isoform X2 [Triticum aestivum]|uniref:BTB/POZ and MATH domain-containing protein 4 isoform X2 n=1 Tax=Triticum aestivum TaxID=4565 RepID=UPI001D02F9F3|nr:BTB/POZ and MATH domain-containing protein 4-like isoform X2 [Triticum aestivum]
MAEHCKISAAIVAGSQEKSCVLKIDRYSRAKALLKNGEGLTSAPFSVGGHDWTIEYYPNGYPKDCTDFISLYLALQSAGAEDVNAKYTLSVLGKNGELLPSYSRTPNAIRTFSRGITSWGYHEFIKKADLEALAHLRDDCLTLRCDITVIHAQETSVPPSDLHRHLGDLLKNKDAADVTFQVGGQPLSAHRYNIGRLKLICEEKLCSHIDSDMVATSLALAEQHGFRRLKDACFQFLTSPSNFEAMTASDGYEHLKSSCPYVLRELIARIIPTEFKSAKDIIMTI